MDSRITELLKRYKLKLAFLPITGKGYIIPDSNGDDSLIVINEALSDEEAEKVILHEIGHARTGEKNIDYKSNYTTRIYSENYANAFLIHEQIKKYVALGNDIATANWLNVAQSIGTQNYLLVRDELLKYTID